jgi:cobalamin-dependent methionine synthase I
MAAPSRRPASLSSWIASSVSSCATLLLGQPDAFAESLETQPTVLQRALTTVVDSSVTTIASVALAFLMGWCIPSTYTIKKKYLRFVSTSRLIRRVESSVPLLLLFLALVWAREYQKTSALQARAARLRQSWQGRSSNDAVVAQGTLTVATARAMDATSDALVSNTVRKYRAAFGVRCACAPCA